jgi:hypothetical protein
MALGDFKPIEILKYKSDLESKKYREEGNKYYLKKKQVEAIFIFNKSNSFSKAPELLSLAYANRSAAYFECEKYQDCIVSIKLARENGYPANKLSKLDEREQKCLEMLMKKDPADDDPWNFFKLSHAANEKIPWMIGGLEMRRTEKYGRGIYATKDLVPGNIIAIEQCSTIFALQGGSHYKYCANCLEAKMLQLLPCTKTGKCHAQNVF